MADPLSYDVILIGSGPQGLITACYLAKNGIKVGVFEPENPHGNAMPYVPFQDDCFTGPVSHLPLSIPKDLIEDLKLTEFGLDPAQMTGSVVTPTPEAKSAFILTNDKERTLQTIKEVSEKDAQSYDQLTDGLVKLAKALAQTTSSMAPNYTEDGWKDMWGIFQTGKFLATARQEIQLLFAEIVKSSLHDFLAQKFETPELRNCIAQTVSLCQPIDGQMAGSAILLLEHFLRLGQDPDTHSKNNLILRGSLHSYISALKDAAQSYGVTFHDDKFVKSLSFRLDGRIEGAELNARQKVNARRVLSDISPALLFKTLIPSEYQSPIIQTRFESKTIHNFIHVKFALKGLPGFSFFKTTSYQGVFQLSSDKKLSIILPSLASAELQSSLHPCSVMMPFNDHKSLESDAGKAALIQSIIDEIQPFAPNFADLVAGSSIISGEALDYGFGATGQKSAQAIEGDENFAMLRLIQMCFPHHSLQAKHGINGLYICGYGMEGTTPPHLNNAYLQTTKDITDILKS